MYSTYFCQICFDNHSYDDGFTLSCGHTYHPQCLFRYLEAKIVDGIVEPCCFMPLDSDCKCQVSGSSVSFHKEVNIHDNDEIRTIGNDPLIMSSVETKSEGKIQDMIENETILDYRRSRAGNSTGSSPEQVNDLSRNYLKTEINGIKRKEHTPLMMNTYKNDDINGDCSDKNYIEINSNENCEKKCSNDYLSLPIGESAYLGNTGTNLNIHEKISVVATPNTDIMIANFTFITNDYNDSNNCNENDNGDSSNEDNCKNYSNAIEYLDNDHSVQPNVIIKEPSMASNPENDAFDTMNDAPLREELIIHSTQVCNKIISAKDIYYIISNDDKLLKSYEYFKFMKENSNARECPSCQNLQIGI